MSARLRLAVTAGAGLSVRLWRAWPANCISPLHLPIQNQTLKDFLWVSDTPFMLTGEM
jgi:hypothetical protein